MLYYRSQEEPIARLLHLAICAQVRIMLNVVGSDRLMAGAACLPISKKATGGMRRCSPFRRRRKRKIVLVKINEGGIPDVEKRGKAEDTNESLNNVKRGSGKYV